MIKFSPRVQALISSPGHVKFYLLSVGDRVFVTNYFRDLAFGGQVYKSDGSLLELEAPEITSSVSKQKFTATFADVGEQRLLGSSNLIGARASIWVVFEDEDGQPLLSSEDVFLFYSGRVDSFRYEVSTAQIGNKSVILTFASPMSALDSVRSIRMNQDYSDGRFPGDTSFDELFTGSRQVSLIWGKK